MIARCAPLLVVSFVTSLAVVACGGGGSEQPAATAEAKKPEIKAPQDDAKESTKLDEAKADPLLPPGGENDDADDGAADPSDPAPGAEGAEGAAEGADGAAAEDDAGAQDDGEAPAEDDAGAEDEGDDDGAAEGDDAGAGKDAAALIKEARTTKTTDERALEALKEAEEAGATVKVLALAAKARADYLYKDPDRAKVFYEWSAAKDEDYAEPLFALAKQHAVTGDVVEVVKLLKQVAERKGGKKLLEQIDFDPTWDIVKEDPDVRALL